MDNIKLQQNMSTNLCTSHHLNYNLPSLLKVPEVEVRKQEPRLDTFAEKYEMRYELMTLHKRQNYVGPHNKFTKESDEETFQLQNKKFYQIGNSSRLVTRILAFYRSLSDSVSSLLMARLFPKSEIVHSTVNI